MHTLPSSSTCHGNVKCQPRVYLKTVAVHKSFIPFCQKGPSNKRQRSANGPLPVTRALELDIDLPDIDLDLGSIQDDLGAQIEVSICADLISLP